MNDIRARFEEIWPAPECIYWHGHSGEYMPNDQDNEHHMDMCMEWDARLDTFTRCQETTDVYVSLVDEMVEMLDGLGHYDADVVIRAKQIMEQKK